MDDHPATEQKPLGTGLFSLFLGLLGLTLPLSLVAAEAVLAGLLAIFLLRLIKGEKLALRFWDLPVVAFFLIRLNSGIFSPHPELAGKGLTHLAFLTTYAITAWNPEGAEPKAWRNFIRGLVLGGAVASVASLYQVADGEHRGIGLSGGWTVFGSLTGAALVLGIYYSIHDSLYGRKYLDISLLTLNAAGLAASICRAEWAAVFIVLLPAAVIFSPRVSALSGAAILALFLAITPLRERLVTLTDPAHNLSGRDIIWSPALDLISEAPILGHGLNSFHAIFPENQRKYMTDPYAGDWHNVYLQVTMESGLLGLAALLWMLGTGLYLAFRRIKSASTLLEAGIAWGLFAGLALFCIAGGLGTFLVRIPVVILVFLMLGKISRSHAEGQTRT